MIFSLIMLAWPAIQSFPEVSEVECERQPMLIVNGERNGPVQQIESRKPESPDEAREIRKHHFRGGPATHVNRYDMSAAPVPNASSVHMHPITSYIRETIYIRSSGLCDGQLEALFGGDLPRLDFSVGERLGSSTSQTGRRIPVNDQRICLNILAKLINLSHFCLLDEDSSIESELLLSRMFNDIDLSGREALQGHDDDSGKAFFGDEP
ncbi:hypothetical protein BDZ97DRAFT_2057190 [Flammula alnicola]|nr:hypothetical protein BDZ97DRAFT_2057190 [Flammula alnicola]